MPKTIKTILTILTLLLASPTLSAAGQAETDFDTMYKRYLDLFSAPDSTEAFFKSSDQMKHYYRQNNKSDSYYRVCMNEALYETEHNNAEHAIQIANNMLKEMEAEGYNGYDLVYATLGTVYESRGNTSMAKYYYQKGIDCTDPSDKVKLMGLQSRIAYLQKFTNPLEALRWNSTYEEASRHSAYYRQAYLFINAMANFALNHHEGFQQALKSYMDFRSDKPELDNYGLQTLDIMRLADEKQYDEALNLIESNTYDLDAIARSDLRILIYQRMGNPEKTISEYQHRIDLVDSLNSNLYFSNINEINAQADVSKTKLEASKDRERMLRIILVLAICLIAILAAGIIHIRRNRKELKEKNNQLATALSMAEESDRMKTAFVRQVSHEIRTPLNAINGFNEILNNPSMTLSDEERNDLTQRINENTNAITTIVNELLQMANDESGKFYTKNDTIFCNQFFSNFIYSYRQQVKAHIELRYSTKVINRFKIVTNKEAVSQILDHLVQNAIKFTHRGTIELGCIEVSGMVYLSLTDTGSGIAPEMQDKIFEQFTKVDSFQQGIGLGLTVSRKIAQKLGGDLELDKHYTDGARFILSLPVA